MHKSLIRVENIFNATVYEKNISINFFNGSPELWGFDTEKEAMKAYSSLGDILEGDVLKWVDRDDIDSNPYADDDDSY